MSKTVWRVTPVNGYDIPGLERWLEEQASKGLRFFMTAGPFTRFVRTEPTSLRFHLEPAPDKPDRLDPELNALYEQAGWKYLGLFRSSFAVFVTENLEAQAHTDPEIWDYALKKFFRRKLLAGLGLLVLNFCFSSLCRSLADVSWYDLRWFPMELFSHKPVIAAALSVLGLALVDLSWLLGSIALGRYRKAVSLGEKPPKCGRSGGLLAVGVVLLLLVTVETLWPLTGLNHHQIDPATDFVTLADIEGDTSRFQVSEQNWNFYHYSYDSGSLFRPERWSFRQDEPRPWVNGSADPTASYLRLKAYRYPLPFLAENMAEEQSRIQWNGGSYEVLSPPQELDQAFISYDQFDPEQDVCPTVRLVLRRGRDILLVEYRGNQDITQFLSDFAQMLETL